MFSRSNKVLPMVESNIDIEDVSECSCNTTKLTSKWEFLLCIWR